MKGIVLTRPVKSYKDPEDVRGAFEFREDLPIPKLGFNQILVRVQRSQINPSDTSYCQGRYGKELKVPCTPGFEGCGVVVQSGGSPFAWRLKHKRVAFFAEGVWAEYVAIDAFSCIECSDDVSFSNMAGAVVNPITVHRMVKIAKKMDAKAVVATAASSALVSQLIRYGRSNGIQIIAIVRKADQIQGVKQVGAAEVLNSEDPGFEEALQAACKKYNCTLAFDSVAGDVGTKVFSALCDGGVLYCYGFLSGKNYESNSTDLIFRGKRLEGLWLSKVMKSESTFSKWKAVKDIAAALQTDFATEVRVVYPLKKTADAILDYTQNMSGGKVQIICGDYEKDLAMAGV